MKGILIILLLMTGCGEAPNPRQFKAADSIRYIKDDRTNLCFARLVGVHGFTNVPCTAEVEKEVK